MKILDKIRKKEEVVEDDGRIPFSQRQMEETGFAPYSNYKQYSVGISMQNYVPKQQYSVLMTNEEKQRMAEYVDESIMANERTMRTSNQMDYIMQDMLTRNEI